MVYCKEFLKKQQRINRLEEEIDSLKARLRYQERTAKEGFFGSSTPSSKLKVMPNSPKNAHAIGRLMERLSPIVFGVDGHNFDVPYKATTKEFVMA